MSSPHKISTKRPACPKCKKANRVTRTVQRWYCLRCGKFFA